MGSAKDDPLSPQRVPSSPSLSGEPLRKATLVQILKDLCQIHSSHGYLLMRLAVAQDAQDAYDVCHRAFKDAEEAIKRLEVSVPGWLHTHSDEEVARWIASLPAPPAIPKEPVILEGPAVQHLADIWDALAEYVARNGDQDIPDGSTVAEGVRALIRRLNELEEAQRS